MSIAALIAAGPNLGCIIESHRRTAFDDMVSKALRVAGRAEQNLTPVSMLTKDEKVGLAIAAGVPVNLVDGKLQTSQPIGVSRIAGHYHCYTLAE